MSEAGESVPESSDITCPSTLSFCEGCLDYLEHRLCGHGTKKPCGCTDPDERCESPGLPPGSEEWCDDRYPSGTTTGFHRGAILACEMNPLSAKLVRHSAVTRDACSCSMGAGGKSA